MVLLELWQCGDANDVSHIPKPVTRAPIVFVARVLALVSVAFALVSKVFALVSLVLALVLLALA